MHRSDSGNKRQLVHFEGRREEGSSEGGTGSAKETGENDEKWPGELEGQGETCTSHPESCARPRGPYPAVRPSAGLGTSGTQSTSNDPSLVCPGFLSLWSIKGPSKWVAKSLPRAVNIRDFLMAHFRCHRHKQTGGSERSDREGLQGLG